MIQRFDLAETVAQSFRERTCPRDPFPFRASIRLGGADGSSGVAHFSGKWESIWRMPLRNYSWQHALCLFLSEPSIGSSLWCPALTAHLHLSFVFVRFRSEFFPLLYIYFFAFFFSFFFPFALYSTRLTFSQCILCRYFFFSIQGAKKYKWN